MSDPCPRLWEVDAYRQQRLGARAARSLERHLRACASCSTQMTSDDRLHELAAALPAGEPSELSLRRLRARVLRDAAAGRAPHPPWHGGLLRVAAAVVVVVAGLVAWRMELPRLRNAENVAAIASAASAAAPLAVDSQARAADAGDAPSRDAYDRFAGSVLASGHALWAQTRTKGVERVRLDEGTLRIHVRRQVPGERFLVELPDGEIEVRGTTFEVCVEGGATTRVQVEEGVVELRLHGRDMQRLEGARSWSAAAAVRSASPLRGPRHATSPPVAVGDGAAYADAMALLRAGRNDQAAAAFDAFARSNPGAPQAEDAAFLEAVSLARAGRPDAAALAAEHYLAVFPGSFHGKEAAILVARAAVKRGDCGKARAALARWASTSEGRLDAESQSALRGCEGQ